MKRQPVRTAAAASVAAAAVMLLSGCGGGDSTVSGSPSTATMAPPPALLSTDEGAPAPTGDGGRGRYTEAPATVAPAAPGFAAPDTSAREKGYLAALTQAGIKTEVLRDPLIAAGNTICRIKTTGGAAGETTTIANAVAGQVVSAGYSAKTAEEVARIVVDASSGQLCP